MCFNYLFPTVFDEPEDPSNRSFFSEIIASISDVKFSHNGRYMLSRDYLTVKVWDINMESKPVETYPVHEHLRSRLCSLYENDSIFDKFECGWNGTDTYPFEMVLWYRMLFVSTIFVKYNCMCIHEIGEIVEWTIS